MKQARIGILVAEAGYPPLSAVIASPENTWPQDRSRSLTPGWDPQQTIWPPLHLLANLNVQFYQMA